MEKDYKAFTKATYQKHAREFDKKFGEHFDTYMKPTADLFLKRLSGSTVLDLGSGPGNHAVYFSEHGLDVTCADISENMVLLCKEKGLRAVVADIENLNLGTLYDGIWINAALLHIPKKNIGRAMEHIIRHLKPEGVLFISVKEGNGEDFETYKHDVTMTRWFTYFTDHEVRTLIGDQFDLLYYGKINVKNKYVFLDYLLKKKSHADNA